MAKKQDSKAIAKYKKENYDRINVDLPKGEREIIKEHVDAKGISMQAYIRQAIYAAINEDRERMLNPPEPYVPREVTKEEIKQWRALVPSGYTNGQIKDLILKMDRERYEAIHHPQRPRKLRPYNVWRFEYETGEDVDALAAEAEYQEALEREYEDRMAQEEAYQEFLMQQQYAEEEAERQAEAEALYYAEQEAQWAADEEARQAQEDARQAQEDALYYAEQEAKMAAEDGDWQDIEDADQFFDDLLKTEE